MIQNNFQDALIICTKDRPNEIKRLIKYLFSNCVGLPKSIIIVDSSEGKETHRAVSEIKNNSSKLSYLHSSYGLPHQRNVGLAYLFANSPKPLDQVFFLDDDCLPSEQFFVKAREILFQHREIGVLGGFDTNLDYKPVRWIESTLGLRRDAPNNISKGGFGTVVAPRIKLQKVLWVPGFAQVIRFNVLKIHRFNGKIRMYGEDVDMHLRIGRSFSLYLSNELPVRHETASLGRDKSSQFIRYESAFRWRLSREYPNIVNSKYVIFTSLLMLIYSLFKSISNPRVFPQALGFGLFLLDVAKRDITEQYVSHSEWKEFNI